MSIYAREYMANQVELKDKKKPFLTVEEERKILGISRVSMYNLIHTRGFTVIHRCVTRGLRDKGTGLASQG